MAQNTVQYQRGLSMLEFFNTYGSPQQCEALVRRWRWPEGFVCPRCQGSWHSEFRRQQPVIRRLCRDRFVFPCYRQCVVRGRVFQDLKSLSAVTHF